MRRLIAYLICAPLALLGGFVAHQSSYFLVEGNHAREHLAETGHGYLSQAPLAIAVLLITLIFSLLLDGVRVAAGQSATKPSIWQFAALGPLTFTIQEHLERWAETGHFPWTAAVEATFTTGLALHLPTTVLAYLLARTLLHTARQVVTAVVARLRRPRHMSPCQVTRTAPTNYRQIFVQHITLAHTHGRAPPLLYSTQH